MPWSNQTGGGGGWKGGGGSGGNGGGPWGQGPQNNRPSGSGSPDLEDILRRGQDRLRRAIPGGGGSGGASAGNGLVLGGLVVAVLALIWAFNAIHMVGPGEYGVKVFLGKPKDELASQGLNFTLWPLETFETVPAVENQLAVGRDGTGGSSGLMLSGDQNIVNVQFAVLYRVDNPQAYLFTVDDPQGMLRQVAESAMREVVGRSPVDDLFRDDRARIAEDVRNIMQDTLNNYGAGLRINAVSIEETAPPTQVASAFDEVQRASQDQDRFVDEANLYRNQQLGQARGEAVQIREDSAAYKNRVVQEAEGEGQRFQSLLGEYEAAPDITRRRLWLETVESALSQSNKVVMDDKAGPSAIPYLNLNDIQRQSRSTNAPARDILPSSVPPALPRTTLPAGGASVGSAPAQGTTR